MNRKRKKIIRWAFILSLVILVIAVLAVFSVSGEEEQRQFDQGENTDVMEFDPFIENEERLDNSQLEYGKVLNKYQSAGYQDYAGDPIVLSGISYSSVGGADVSPFTTDLSDEAAEAYIAAEPSAIMISNDTTTLTYNFKVSETALYSLCLDYLLPPGNGTEASVSLLVNGKRPFFESTNIQLGRLYTFYDVGKEDIYGNEIKAKQKEIFEWQQYYISNPEGIYRNPYKILLQASDREQELTLTFSRQACLLRSVSLTAPVNNPSYEEYRASISGDAYTGEALDRIEIEDSIISKNDIALVSSWDDNYCSSPASYELIDYNIFGGEGWSSGGQSLTFSIGEVPEDGWYQIAFRYMSPLADVAAYREIRIDGEIPFKEMEEYCFPVANSWVCEPLMDKDQQPYLFYLEAGVEHTITMTVKLGPLRHQVQRMNECTDYLTSLVKKVVQVTGSARNSDGTYQVDKNRDWDLQLYIPDIQEEMNECRDSLQEIYDTILKLNGDRIPYYSSSIKVAQELFARLAEDTEEIPASVNDINSNATSFADIIVNIKNQPLTLDYGVLSQEGETYEDATSSFLQNTYVAIKRFALSFTTDYAAIGTTETFEGTNMPEISVYASMGREQYEILQNLVTESFTRDHNIKVNLTMVNGAEGIIMLRYVAGTAPDASLTFLNTSVVEYAMRGALYPMDTLDGFMDYVNGENSPFSNASFTLGQYRGHYYGMPETLSWSALFYRTDIMEELGINPEELNTWDDIYEILPILQEENMEFAYNNSVANFYPFLFQHGGDIYDVNGKASGLNTTEAYAAYQEFCDLYIRYKVPYAANFYQRFRNGDIPIGIGDHSLYGQLQVSAPEIAGKWDFRPIPGHVDEETGEVVRYATGTGSMSIILSSTKMPEESWEFIQWWTSADTQSEFSQEVEIVYGVASRWHSSNLEALDTTPYTEHEKENILEQWKYLKEVPNVPGGYYTSRYLLTALNKTILQGENPRANLEDAIKEINKEMARKQEEFGIGENDSVLWATMQ